jgi:hypothetical protein
VGKPIPSIGFYGFLWLISPPIFVVMSISRTSALMLQAVDLFVQTHADADDHILGADAALVALLSRADRFLVRPVMSSA